MGVHAQELKYDGERVQAHYAGGTNFAFFARSLKPVKDDKVADVRAHLPTALPGVASIVLDAEVLRESARCSARSAWLSHAHTHLGTRARARAVVDKAGTLLKFGSLGVHKRKGFADACVCLFIFDILALNGVSLLDKSYEERRRTLEATVRPVPRRIQLSQTTKIDSTDALKKLMRETIGRGEEGLVLKDARGAYEPGVGCKCGPCWGWRASNVRCGAGKRHWLKIKRDYLGDGAMADSADLVVLGAYFGADASCGAVMRGCCAVADLCPPIPSIQARDRRVASCLYSSWACTTLRRTCGKRCGVTVRCVCVFSYPAGATDVRRVGRFASVATATTTRHSIASTKICLLYAYLWAGVHPRGCACTQPSSLISS